MGSLARVMALRFADKWLCSQVLVSAGGCHTRFCAGLPSCMHVLGYDDTLTPLLNTRRCLSMHLLPRLADRPVPSACVRARPVVTRRHWHGTGLWPWAWLLALVLLAQNLGQVHGVLHAGAAQGEISEQHLGGAKVHANRTDSWLSHLFDGHTNATDCRLYDQISQSDCMPTAAHLLALAIPIPVLTTPSPESALPRPTLRVKARGPPRQA